MNEFDIDASPEIQKLPSVSEETGEKSSASVPASAHPKTPTPIRQRPPISRHGSKDRKDKLRFLVVEDDRINRAILCKRLKMDGHEVVESTNGQEAVEQIEKDRMFDGILMDIQMPILDGFEATEHIRAYEKAHHLEIRLGHRPRHSGESNNRVPVFAVSASLRESQRQTMVNRGMDGWILKPVDFKRLRTILQGINDHNQRSADLWRPGCSWEAGGWLHNPDKDSSAASSSSSLTQTDTIAPSCEA